MMRLNLHARIRKTQALGPFQRYALWLQGCPFHCQHCLAPQTLPFDAGEQSNVDTILADIQQTSNIEGVTISGGEPFAQAEGLAVLVQGIQRQQLGVIIYTGYTLAYLQQQSNLAIQQVLQHCDLLIDGLYVDELNDGLSLRGSSNQQIHSLTDRYQHEHYYAQPQRAVEIHLLDDAAMLVGVPGKNALQRWQETFSS